MVEELLDARGIEATYETVRHRALKFCAGIARRIRAMERARGEKWHLDEVVVTINGHKHRLWRAVDQYGTTLDLPEQNWRDRHAPRRLMRKPLNDSMRSCWVSVSDQPCPLEGAG